MSMLFGSLSKRKGSFEMDLGSSGNTQSLYRIGLNVCFEEFLYL